MIERMPGDIVRIVGKFNEQGQMPQASEIAARLNSWHTVKEPVNTQDVIPLLEQMVHDRELVVEYEIRGKGGNHGSKVREAVLYRLPESAVRPKLCTNIAPLLVQCEWLTYMEFMARFGEPSIGQLMIKAGQLELDREDEYWEDLYAVPGENYNIAVRQLQRLGETDGRRNIE